MPIRFFSEGISFRLKHPTVTANWIRRVVQNEGYLVDSLDYIFCSDEYLSTLNLNFLRHKTLTDIITFDYADTPGSIAGEVYISIPRVKENAAKFKQAFDQELHRVIIHGVLHLLGYNDKKSTEKAKMREKEEACLSLRKVSRGTKGSRQA